MSVLEHACVQCEMSRRHSPTAKSKAKETASPSNTNEDQKRYCICQKRDDELDDQDSNDFMIECDGCNGWFHSSCIGLADRIAGRLRRSVVSLIARFHLDDLEKYFCAECSKQHGPSIGETHSDCQPSTPDLRFVVKQRRNQHRRDFNDANAEDKVDGRP